MKLTQEQIEKAQSLAKSEYEASDGFIARLADVLQYAPIEPGAPLSDAEKEQLRVPLGAWMSGRLETGHLYIAINTVLARRNVRTEAPAVADVGLVHRMLDAFNQEAGDNIGGEAAMTAALRVAADALLKGATTSEIDAAKHAYDEYVRIVGPTNTTELSVLREALKAALQNFLNGRARLLAPARSVEDFRVLRVARIVSRFEGVTDSVAVAKEIIATLKQEAAK